MTDNDTLIPLLERIAAALERQNPPENALPTVDWQAANAFVWDASRQQITPVSNPSVLPLSLILGVDEARDTLLQNTRQFAAGYAANNALLWGARGMGKSSLVKAVCAEVNRLQPEALALIEIHREDIADLPLLLRILTAAPRRFIVFCDDLTFDAGDASYKSLKTVLEGGIEGRPDNVLFYATSNRRHMLPREMMENERASAIHPGEAVEEKVSLSDRFGLSLGFYPCDQETYLNIVHGYAQRFRLDARPNTLRAEALEWAARRGARSGRVAWQFIQDFAGRMQKTLV